MTRRRFLVSAGAAWFALRAPRGVAQEAVAGASDSFAPLKKTLAEWSALLEPDRYEVLFHEDTEFPGTSPLNGEKRRGTYICAACFLPLFRSEHKFDSGTGWPSFTQPIEGRIGKKVDRRMRVPRVEYHCARCGGHQGHVFDDGPPPRGERWCNNGLALQFVPQSAALPRLRT